MVFDPCTPIPDTFIPAGLPIHPHPIYHQVVGRIRHRASLAAHRAARAHTPNPYGCEQTAPRLPASPPQRLPASPPVATAGGAGIGAITGFSGLIGYMAGHPGIIIRKKPHLPGDPVHIPEPPIVLVFFVAALLTMALRKFWPPPSAKRATPVSNRR